MKLFGNPASPFVRKTHVLAIETGLADRIDRQTAAVTPVTTNDEVIAGNPLGKIPCLMLDDGRALYDSRVICEYLDSLHDGPRMIPAEGSARFEVLRRQALADGLMDAAVLTRYETFIRPEPLRWDEWIKGQLGKVTRAVEALEREDLGSTVDLGTIAIGCALGYLDFRFAEMGWRTGHDRLAAWFETFDARASMQATRPG